MTAEIRRPADRYAIKWFGISLGLHLVTVFAFAALAPHISKPGPPVIIDLTFDAGPAPVADVTPPRKQLQAARTIIARIPAPVRAVEKVSATIEDKHTVIAPAPVEHPPAKPAEPIAAAQNSVSQKTRMGDESGITVEGARRVIGKPMEGNSTMAGDGNAAAAEKSNLRYQRENFAYIRDLITRRLVYPYQARKMGWSGGVTVSFVVNEDGSAHDIKIVKGSGFPMLDRSAMDTVRMVAPFPKPPVRAVIIIPVIFKLM